MCWGKYGGPIARDDFQIAILMNSALCKKHKKLQYISSKILFNIPLLFLNN